MADCVFTELWSRKRAGIRAWVTAGVDAAEPQNLFSSFHNQARHQTLWTGGVFDVRSLADPTLTDKLVLQASTLQKVDSWGEAAKASDRTYCQARERDEAAIDAIQQPANITR